MAISATSYFHLAPNPRSAYRQLFVKGTRVRARVLYGWYAREEPMAPEEIARDFNLPVEAAREAIAYCESNPPELAEGENGAYCRCSCTCPGSLRAAGK